MTSELGDFQTPSALADQVLAALRRDGVEWQYLLEPTCGSGNFLVAAFNRPDAPREALGVEIQARYLASAASRLSRMPCTLRRDDVFKVDLKSLIPRHWSAGRLVVVGNPPWVTNAALGAISSTNLPAKRNLKSLRGLEAITGSANFDVAEFIWLKLIESLGQMRVTIALLCKLSVARNVLSHLGATKTPIGRAWVRKFDASKAFGVGAAACLLVVDLDGTTVVDAVNVYSSLTDNSPLATWKFGAHGPIQDSRRYRDVAHLEASHAQVEWRQGVKHDAAGVLELRLLDQASDTVGTFENRAGIIVELELSHVYPLIKGTPLHHGRTKEPESWVVLPQRRVGESTDDLRTQAPLTLAYLWAHAERFRRRKSSIYRGRDQFAIFGIGAYSFAPYKVAVSGLHKTAHFSAVGPLGGKPVMFDDTCYFVPCKSPQQAVALAAVLNSPAALAFFESVVSVDAKRPYTKKTLGRLDLVAAIGDARHGLTVAKCGPEYEALEPGQRWRWSDILSLLPLATERPDAIWSGTTSQLA